MPVSATEPYPGTGYGLRTRIPGSIFPGIAAGEYQDWKYGPEYLF